VNPSPDSTVCPSGEGNRPDVIQNPAAARLRPIGLHRVLVRRPTIEKSMANMGRLLDEDY
jgi:hypothetical protein